MQRLFVFLLFWLALPAPTPAQTLTIQNHSPRRTADGAIVDAHDGRLIEFEGRFYWYGTQYGTTNGFTKANRYVSYSSPDLQAWKPEGPMLENAPEGVYYRPHVVYNPGTQQYVMWYNWYPVLWEGRFGVAVSDSPTGPFRIVNDNVEMARSKEGLGDLGLYVDVDGACYLSYNTIQNHRLSIEKLSPDFLSSSGENGGIIAEHVEAGAMFLRDGKYYLLTDHTCCFCNEGSGARVYVADRPMGPYGFTGNINRHPGAYSAVLNGSDHGHFGASETLTRQGGEFPSIEIWLEEPTYVSEIALTRLTGNRPANCGTVDEPRVHPEIGKIAYAVEYWADGDWRPVSDPIRYVAREPLTQAHHQRFADVLADRFRVRFLEELTTEEKLQLTGVTMQGRTERGLNAAIAPATQRVYITGKGQPRRPVIPAQQAFVTRIETATGPEFIWVGDLWGSASDNVKGHDYQAWVPMTFRSDGTILPLEWTRQFTIER